jgi:hypothetical protein
LQIAQEEGRLLVAAKTTFPMATMTYAGPPKSKLGELIDDELPF